MKLKIIIFSLATAVLLLGCGGGSSDGTTTVVTSSNRLVKVEEFSYVLRDSTPVLTYNISYNSDNYVDKIEYYDGDSLVVSETYSYTYDSDHNRVGIEVSGSGVSQKLTYTYNGSNIMTGYYRDADDDGIVDNSIIYDVTAENIVEKYESFNEPAHTLVGTTTLTYDSENRLTAESLDTDNDTIAENTITYSYSDDGKLTTEVAVGNSNYTKQYTYDNDGKITKIEKDQSSDGSVNSARTFIYDANSNIVNVYDDNDNDGTIDESATLTYESGEEHGAELIWTQLYDSYLLASM